MTRKTILKFGAVEHAEAGDLPGWIVVEGRPTMQTAVQHTTADGKVMSGTWRATPGTYHATYTDYEFVHMIAGRIIITPDGGEPDEVGPGDAFVVEADYQTSGPRFRASTGSLDYVLAGSYTTIVSPVLVGVTNPSYAGEEVQVLVGVGSSEAGPGAPALTGW